MVLCITLPNFIYIHEILKQCSDVIHDGWTDILKYGKYETMSILVSLRVALSEDLIDLTITKFGHNYKLMEAKWRIYVSVQHTNIGSDNGLSHVQCQAIIWTNAAILSITL